MRNSLIICRVFSCHTSKLKSFAVGPQRAVSRTKVAPEVAVAPGIVDHHHTQPSGVTSGVTTAAPGAGNVNRVFRRKVSGFES